jgi:hypothetical protein
MDWKSRWKQAPNGERAPKRGRAVLSADAREELERRRQINEDSPRNPPRWIAPWRVRSWLRHGR